MAQFREKGVVYGAVYVVKGRTFVTRFVHKNHLTDGNRIIPPGSHDGMATVVISFINKSQFNSFVAVNVLNIKLIGSLLHYVLCAVA